MDGKPKILYNNLVKSGMNVGSYDQFSDKIKDDDNRRSLYHNLTKLGWDTKDYPTFSENLGYKPVNFWDKTINPVLGHGKQQSTRPMPNVDDSVKEDVDGVGNFFKNIYNSLAEGTTKTIAGAANILAVPLTVPVGVPGNVIEEQQNLQKAQGKIMDVEQGINKAITTPNEEALSQKYSFGIHGKTVGENVGAVLSGIAGMIPQIAGASVTGGATYFMAGYDDGLKEARQKGLGANASQAYALMAGGLNKLMMDLPISHALDKTIVKKFVNKYSTKLLADAIEKNGGKELDAKAMEAILDKAKVGIAGRLKVGGVKALKNFVEGVTYGTIGTGGEMISKKTANALEGKQKFTTDDFTPEKFVNGVLQQGLTIGGIGLAGTGLGFLSTHTGNYIKDRIVNAKTPEDINNVKQELLQSPAIRQMKPEYQQQLMGMVDNLNGIAQSIPKNIPDEDKKMMIDIISERNNIIAKNKGLKDASASLDPALKGEHDKQIQANEDMVSLLNDRLKEVSTGNNYKYFHENGNFYKQMRGQQPEPITEGHYELKNMNEDISEAHVKPTITPITEQDQFVHINPVLSIPEHEINDNRIYTMTFETGIKTSPDGLQAENIPESLKPYITAFNHTGEGKGTVDVKLTGAEAKEAAKSFNAETDFGGTTPEQEQMPAPIHTDFKAQKPVEPAQAVPSSQPQRVSDNIGKQMVYDYNGKKEVGKLVIDGKTVILDTPNRDYEIGNIDEIGGNDINQHGLSFETPSKKVVAVDNPAIKVIDNGRITLLDKTLNGRGGSLIKSINRGQGDRILSVTLVDEAGQHQTFSGQQGQEIAYKILRDTNDKIDKVSKKSGNDLPGGDPDYKKLSGDQKAVNELAAETGMTPEEVENFLNNKSIVNNLKQIQHESEIKETGTVKGETGESTQAPGTQGSHQEGEGGKLQERLTTPGEQIPEKGGAVQKAVPPSFVLSAEAKQQHVAELDKKIEGLTNRGKEFEDAGNKKQADRLAKDADNVKAKKEFTDKTDMKLDDVINHLKELKRLKIDCKGKGATIRKK